MTMEETSTRVKPPRVLILAVIGAISVFAFYYVQYIRVIHPDVPYMDTLRLIIYHDDIENGSMSFWHAWKLGAHRGLLGQLLLEINARFFSLNILGANIASGIVLIPTAIVIVGLAAKELTTFEKIGSIPFDFNSLFLLVVLLCLFSLSSFELFTLDYGLTLFIKNLLLIVFWASLNNLLTRESTNLALWILLMLCAAALVLLVAMGWSYAFFIACAVLICDGLLNRPRSTAIILKASGLLIIMAIGLWLYVTAGGGVGALSSFAGGKAEDELSMGNVVSAVFLALSSVFMGIEVIDSLKIPRYVQEIFGAGLMIACGISCLSRLRGNGPKSGLPYALMAYGFACIVAVAVARGRVDPGFARAGRYFMDYSLILVGLCWSAWYGALSTARSSRRLQILTAISACLCVSVFFGGQLVTQALEWRKAPYRAAAFDAMREATLSRQIGAAEASLLQANSVEVAQRGVDIQAKRGIGVFRNLEKQPPLSCSIEAGIFQKGWYGLESHGRWMGAQSTTNISGCKGRILMKFFIPAEFEKTALEIRVANSAPIEVVLEPGNIESVVINLPTDPVKIMQLKVATTHKPPLDAPDQRELGVLLGSITNLSDGDRAAIQHEQ